MRFAASVVADLRENSGVAISVRDSPPEYRCAVLARVLDGSMSRTSETCIGGSLRSLPPSTPEAGEAATRIPASSEVAAFEAFTRNLVRSGRPGRRTIWFAISSVTSLRGQAAVDGQRHQPHSTPTR